MPALAVADALRAEGAEVSFVGGERAEAELVPAAGYELDPIEAEGISRSNPLKAARAAAKAAKALGTARAILRRRRPDAVLGGGGYVAGPVGLVAALKGVPLVLTEADSHLGLTNRVLARRARRVCLAFPLEGREPPRYRVTGRPVPPRVGDRDTARERARHRPRRDRRARLRRLARRALDQRGRRPGVRRRRPTACCTSPGARDFANLRAPDERYILLDYLVPFGTALAAADLAVARAGGSIFELAQYGVPAVLDPVSARLRGPPDHQRPVDGGGGRGGGAGGRRADARPSPRRPSTR